MVSGGELTRLPHNGAVGAAAFSPDGRWLATISTDKTSLWDAAIGSEVVTIDHGGLRLDVVALAFSPDGRWLATNSDGGQVWALDEEAGDGE
jgi:WD40 repeat protein